MSARACGQSCRREDLAGSRLGWLVWGLPAALIMLGAGWSSARAWLWIPALVVAGTACVANASRCGRLHCFATGPLFLLGALVTLLDAAGLVAIDWRWILAALVGGTAVAFVPEWIPGNYVRMRRSERTRP